MTCCPHLLFYLGFWTWNKSFFVCEATLHKQVHGVYHVQTPQPSTEIIRALKAHIKISHMLLAVLQKLTMVLIQFPTRVSLSKGNTLAKHPNPIQPSRRQQHKLAQLTLSQRIG